ncbi:MAG: hypothetical protein Q8M29_19180 [Bacteroidota bacterium]|nr:hypothetical protein [Bacteroidota bacterium]
MTEEEAKALLLEYCNKEYGKYSLLSLKEREITLEITEIMPSWRKDANLSLPANISFSEPSKEFVIDHTGINFNGKLLKWNEVALTAIAVHFKFVGKRNYDSEYYFIGCLTNGETIEGSIGNIIAVQKKYSNLLGHFIEMYKNQMY